MFVLAHRGNSGHAPENTLAAFRSALAAEADGIECDIYLTKDGRFAVCHDENIDRTSTGAGKISEMTFEDLRAHDFGVKFNEKFRGEKIPLLEEMLEVVSPMKIINIEIKHLADGPLENPYRELCGILHGLGVFDKVIISSFDTEALRRIYEADNGIYTAYLCGGGEETLKTAVSLKCKAIHPYFGNITYGYMRSARAAGLAVNAWTADARDEILFCKNIGCDIVITNEPALAKTLIF